MGWKGNLRSINSGLKQIAREAEKQQKIALKSQIIQEAASSVDSWQNNIRELTSIHTDLAEAMDWSSIAKQPKPSEPSFQNTHSIQAQEKLNRFKPGFFDFLSGGSEKRRQKLIEKLSKAESQDQIDYENELTAYRQSLEEWERETDLAKRLLTGESSSIQEVISEFQSLSKIELIGSNIEFLIGDNFVHAKPEVHTDEIVPTFRLKQLASGKLSETKMPIGQFNELYQDYVASVALKLAGDLFHILPLEEIYVTCQTDLLNSKTGHKELTPILSVQFVRETFRNLNLSRIDPSDSLANFNHVMSFKKTRGFTEITPLKAPVEG